MPLLRATSSGSSGGGPARPVPAPAPASASSARPPKGLPAPCACSDPGAVEAQPPDVLTGAITDLLVTVGGDRPPRGYHRISQTASGLDPSRVGGRSRGGEDEEEEEEEAPPSPSWGGGLPPSTST